MWRPGSTHAATHVSEQKLLPTPPASAAAPWRNTPILPPAWWSPLLHVKESSLSLGYSSFCGSFPIIQPNDLTQQAFNQKSLTVPFPQQFLGTKRSQISNQVFTISLFFELCPLRGPFCWFISASVPPAHFTPCQGPGASVGGPRGDAASLSLHCFPRQAPSYNGSRQCTRVRRCGGWRCRDRGRWGPSKRQARPRRVSAAHRAHTLQQARALLSSRPVLLARPAQSSYLQALLLFCQCPR